MERQIAYLAPETTASNVIEIRVPAKPGPLAVMRAVAGDVAMRADFDVDSIADVRLAVEEACTTLAKIATPGAPLVCRFHTEGDRFVAVAEAISDSPSGPDTDTFSWRVLNTLADTVSTERIPDTDETNLVRIELTKAQAVVTGEQQGWG